MEQLRERDLMMPQEIRQLPPDKMLVISEGQNPILADKLRFFAVKRFRDLELFSRTHIPFVPAMEFLPSAPVPATTAAYQNAGADRAVAPRQEPAAQADPFPADRPPDASAHREQAPEAVEARFKMAAKRLKDLIASRTKPGSDTTNWSKIFDEAVPDAWSELESEDA
ncbi:type IV secretory system conjugative DNA transfer family protein [Mesorhizobium sp. 43Arga]